MEGEEDIRKQVAKVYEKAMERSQERFVSEQSTDDGKARSCRDGRLYAVNSCCSCQKLPSSLASSAGYTPEQKEKYGEAAASSFACGNPLAFAEVRPGQVVLDLGSGAGLDLLIAAEKVGPTGKVIGVDMVDKMISAARRNAERAGYGSIVEVRRGHIEDLPVSDNSIDWIVSNCVINLSPDKGTVFREIMRVLKPGGRFSVSDIVAVSDDVPDWVRADAASYTACVAGAIPESEYLSGLRDAGLVDVRIDARMTYTGSQIRDMIGNNPEAFGIDDECSLKRLPEVADKFASVKVTGRRPL